MFRRRSGDAVGAAWTARQAARSSGFLVLGPGKLWQPDRRLRLTAHQAPLLVGNGLTPTAVAGGIGLYGFSWTAGTLVWGLLIERFSSRLSLAATSLLVAICCAGALFVRDTTALIAYALVYGISNAAKEVVDSTVWADYFGRQSVGAIRGLSRPFVVGSGALGTFAGGLGYDLTGGYTVVALIFSALALCGVGVSLLARPPSGRLPEALA